MSFRVESLGSHRLLTLDVVDVVDIRLLAAIILILLASIITSAEEGIIYVEFVCLSACQQEN